MGLWQQVDLLPFSNDAASGSSLTATEDDQLKCQQTLSEGTCLIHNPLWSFGTVVRQSFQSLQQKQYKNNKYRARLAPENDRRLTLSTTISPQIDRLGRSPCPGISFAGKNPPPHTHPHMHTQLARLQLSLNGGPWGRTSWKPLI